MLPPASSVKVGDRVKGGASVLAYLPTAATRDSAARILPPREVRMMDPDVVNGPRRTACARACTSCPRCSPPRTSRSGYYAILEVMHASMAETWHLDYAAKAIGFAVLFDGLDGRIARMTHTDSDFGTGTRFAGRRHHFRRRPRDAGLDVGLSPDARGPARVEVQWAIKLTQLGAIACFVFLMAGASRLARFNIARIRSPRIPGARARNISSVCRFPPALASSPPCVHFPEGDPLDFVVHRDDLGCHGRRRSAT